ncbi:MAG TPA: hypothetical protein VJP02_03640 [Candidatus Sulfotelmatobacter sp.]|nr:hypothetical protein [Candidatus Sulfotelmatobacter sp.]
MNQRVHNYLLCFGLSLYLLGASGCMMGGHGGGGGGGGKGIPGATLTSIAPSNVVAGGPAFTLDVKGSGFVPGGSLFWNTSGLGTYTFVSSSEVTIQIGAGLITTPGTANITATIPTPKTNPSNALTLTIGSFSSSACVLFGSYNFFFTGFDAAGPVTIAGQFGVDANGNVNGEEDFKDLAGTHTAIPITGGSCANSTTTNEGTLGLTTSMGTSHYTFATQTKPVPGVNGQIAEATDANGISGSGRFKFAPPGAYLNGSYVIAVVGADPSGGRMGLVGEFTDNDSCSNCAGSITAGVGDSNDNGTLTSSTSISGSTTVTDLYSRSAVTLNFGTQTLQFAFYIVSSSLAFAIETDSGTSSPLLAGFVGTQANPGLYANNHLNAPVVFSAWGANAGPVSSDTSIGLVSGFNSLAGTCNLQVDAVSGGVVSLNQMVVATYQVESSGRATMSYTVGGKTHNGVLYLDDQNDGYILENSGSVPFGFFEAQSAGPFSNSSLDGTYSGGTWFTPAPLSPNFTGAITMSNGNITGDITGTYTVDPTTGRGTATVNLPVFGSNDVVLYIVAPNSFYIMGSDGVSNDTIGFLHL